MRKWVVGKTPRLDKSSSFVGEPSLRIANGLQAAADLKSAVASWVKHRTRPG
jgi:hypothetical protein